MESELEAIANYTELTKGKRVPSLISEYRCLYFGGFEGTANAIKTDVEYYKGLVDTIHFRFGCINQIDKLIGCNAHTPAS